MNPSADYHPFHSRDYSGSGEYRQQAEPAIIEKAQTGDLEAFNSLVRNYQSQVYRQAFYMLNDEAAAEDATQEAFILAYRKLHTFLGGSFRSWILKITTNYCLDLIRIRKRRTFIPLETFNEYGEEIETTEWLEDPGDTPEKSVERNEIMAALGKCINLLSPKYRMAVVLIDLQELDYQEAAAVLGIPIGTLKSRLARARVQIQRTLETPMCPSALHAGRGDVGRMFARQAYTSAAS
jgi:RNA polymerase sigma-70 factor (ECF subfamily)